MVESARNVNPHFTSYIRLLVQLHQLIAEGKGESDDADRVRDQMDVHWYQLNGEELALADGLSADLYTLGVDRSSPASKPSDASWNAFSQAAERQDWCKALEILRASEIHLPPALVAYIRGACWAYLEQFDVAIVFFRERERLQPLDAAEEALLLSCLIRAGKTEEAVSRAERIGDDACHPHLLKAAAEAFSIVASDLDSERHSLSPQRT